jgi:hypothetical protein
MVGRGSGVARVRAIAIVLCACAAGAALARPRTPLGTFGYRHWSIYPWWSWALVAAGALGGLVMLFAPTGGPGRAWRGASAAAVAVSGSALAGTGVVAYRHWRPASGMGGYGVGEIPHLEELALVLAAAAGAAAVLAIWQLLDEGHLHRQLWAIGSAAGVLVGAAILVLLPLLVMVGDQDADLQTWGAIGLVYAGPWGAALMASAWATRPVALALVGTAAGCAALAAVGPQMADLLDLSADTRFAAVALVLAALPVVSLRRTAGAPAPGRP